MTPLAPPRDFTVPEEGSTTARDVLSRAVGRLMRDLPATLRAHAASAPRDALAVGRALVSVPPGALASVLRRPHVGGLLRTLRGTPPGEGAELLTELLATLSFDLAHIGALPAAPALGQRPPRIVSLAARKVVPWAADGGEPFHVVAGDIVLALADNNPLALFEAHPDKQGNAIDLGGHSLEEWLTSLRDALALVAELLPDLRAEMTHYIQAIVPVGFFEEKHLSASYREAIGTLYLSLHPHPMTMVEALIHEFQHNKLNALFELDEVLLDAQKPVYASPVRPDLRPLHGVLLAVHAFVPVARLYERLIERGGRGGEGDGESGKTEARFRDVVRINREGTEVLRQHARPTAVGAGVMDELLRWDAHYARRA